jgi:hypothetical protein
MKRLSLLSLLSLALIICGCATVDVTKTAQGYYQPTDPNNVEILMTKPDRKFIELAMVTTSHWPTGDTAKMHNSLRAKCAPLGADAVILLSSGIDGSGQFWSSGVAIRYVNK